MKKFLSILLGTVMLTSVLAACGGSDSSVAEPASEAPAVEEPASEAPEEEPAEEEEEPAEPATDGSAAEGVADLSIGVAIYDFSDNFMTLYRNELERYLTAGGASVQLTDGKNDQSEQTNQIENFINQGVDVLIINLVQSSAAEQITDKCDAAGIPVVYINREPEEAEQQRWADNDIKATYVGADARQSGTFQGEIIVDLADNGDVNGDGVVNYVMIMGDPENVDAQYRTEFSIKALEDAGIEVNQLFEQRGDWDQTKGQELAANALTAYGDDVEVIFCNNDAMAMGALQAIEAAGRTIGEDIYLVGVDALSEALDAIEEGRMTGTVFNDHFSQAQSAADRASDFANDRSVDTIYVVDYVKVTPDNASEIKDML